jgi:hypothetical protein
VIAAGWPNPIRRQCGVLFGTPAGSRTTAPSVFLLTLGWARPFGSPNESPKNPTMPVSSQKRGTIDYSFRGVPLRMFQDGRRMKPRL